MGAAHHQAGTVQAWDRRAIRGRSSGPTSASTASTTSRVADTSIYPDNVMHNTNLTALVVGEKAARLIDRTVGAKPAEAGADRYARV